MTSPIFLAFIGDEQLSLEEKFQKEISPYLNLDQTTYYGNEIDVSKIDQAYNSHSLFSNHSLIVLKKIEDCPLAIQNKLCLIFEYENPNITVFILGGKLDKRSKLGKLIKKKGKLEEFKMPWSNQIPSWIINRSKKIYKKNLTISDAQLFWELVGDSLKIIDNELAKINTALPDTNTITEKEILHYVGSYRNQTIFEMQNFFGLRKKKQAILSLQNLLAQKDPPFLIASRLFNHFTKLSKAYVLYQKKQDFQSIAKEIGVHEFLFKKDNYKSQVISRTMKEWEESLIILSQLEYQFKQGKYAHDFEVELAFASIL